MGSSNSCCKGGHRDTKEKATKTTATTTTTTMTRTTTTTTTTTMTTTAAAAAAAAKTTTKPLDTTTKPLKISLKNGPFVWKIDGFSSLLKQGNKITLTAFHMHGYKWLLGVDYMDTKRVGTSSAEHYLSLILILGSNTLTDCVLDTKFKFFIYDQKYGMHIEHEACHTYKMNDCHYGASCIISLAQLKVASSSFLPNDTLVVGVELIQVKTLPCSLEEENTNFIQNDKSNGP